MLERRRKPAEHAPERGWASDNYHHCTSENRLDILYISPAQYNEMTNLPDSIKGPTTTHDDFRATLFF